MSESMLRLMLVSTALASMILVGSMLLCLTRTPGDYLSRAAMSGDVEGARGFLDRKGEDLDPRQVGEALHQAVLGSSPQVVHELLVNGGDVQQRDIVFAFHRACAFGEMDCVEEFLRQGVDPDAVDPRTGWTALHHAALYGRQDVIHLLLDEGASTSLENGKGLTALGVARNIADHRLDVPPANLQQSVELLAAANI